VARIIVIEDSPALQRFFDITMRGTGVEVEPYLFGADGLEAAAIDPPDLIILDLGLPDLSGWDVLERLRADPATFAIPVVITTGETWGSIADRASALGAVILEKPYTGAVLRATALMHLGVLPVAVTSGT
jgi:DNA-binding response OmpR family regulator